MACKVAQYVQITLLANDWVDDQLDGNNEVKSLIWRDKFLTGEITAEEFKRGPF